jgi:hypothetical protein
MDPGIEWAPAPAGYRMPTTSTVLRRGINRRAGDLTLTLDRAFQGLPETAHGGSVLGAVDLVAGIPGSRTVSGIYRRRVRVGVPLSLSLARADGEVAYRLLDGADPLVEGRVRGEAASVAVSPPAPARHGHALPISRTCFACGIDNPLGLRLRLYFDDETVHAAWTSSDGFREDGGALAAVALTTLLDEAAFWLGALATGEAGMTTDLRVTLHRRVLADGGLTVVGQRAAIAVRPDDARYLNTDVAVLDGDGVVATAQITFVTVRGAARRLVTGLLAMNDVATLRRVFPSYTSAA